MSSDPAALATWRALESNTPKFDDGSSISRLFQHLVSIQNQKLQQAALRKRMEIDAAEEQRRQQESEDVRSEAIAKLAQAVEASKLPEQPPTAPLPESMTGGAEPTPVPLPSETAAKQEATPVAPATGNVPGVPAGVMTDTNEPVSPPAPSPSPESEGGPAGGPLLPNLAERIAPPEPESPIVKTLQVRGVDVPIYSHGYLDQQREEDLRHEVEKKKALTEAGEHTFTFPEDPKFGQFSGLTMPATTAAAAVRSLLGGNRASENYDFTDYMRSLYPGKDVNALSPDEVRKARQSWAESGKVQILGGMNRLYEDVDPKALADAIISGAREPNTATLGRPAAAAVDSELAKRGFNKTHAMLDYKMVERAIASLDGTQQTRMRQAAQTALASLDIIDELAGQWKGGRFPALNSANLALARQGAYGPDAQQIANQLEAQITDVTSELAQVYMGGGTPTDEALKLAQKNLSAAWSEATLKQNTKLARANLQVRMNSMSLANTNAARGISGEGNAYVPTQPAQLHPSAPGPASASGFKDGDTKTINGVSYTRRNGVWTRN